MPALEDANKSAVRAPAWGRTMTRWTTTDLEVVEALVGGGNLERAALLCWSLLGDGRVRAALETRAKGLLRLPLDFEEAGDRRSSGRVAKALRGGDFAIAHPEASLASLGAWGIILGIGIAQRVWEERDGRLLGVLRPYNARFLRWDTRRRVWVVRTELGEVDVVRGSRRWVLYAPSCSGWPDGDELPWMYGAWRGCMKPWLGKDYSWGDWMDANERDASAIRVADTEAVNGEFPSKTTRDDATATLAALHGKAALVLAPGLKARLLSSEATAWETFRASIADASAEIVVAITGQTTSTEAAKGQDTAATLHGRVRQDLIDGDAQTLSTCLREQCLVDYAALNFASGDLAPWPKYQTAPPADVKGRGDALKALGDGMAALAKEMPEGKALDRVAILESAGVPMLDAATPPPAPKTAPASDDESQAA